MDGQRTLRKQAKLSQRILWPPIPNEHPVIEKEKNTPKVKRPFQFAYSQAHVNQTSCSLSQTVATKQKETNQVKI